MLQRTTAQRKIAKLRKRVRIVQGGTSSSKTFSIIPILIDYAIRNPAKEISIVAESIPHLRRGAIRDFIKIMQWTGNFREEQFNRSSLKYNFLNNSYIEFFSADQPDRLRGARRDVLFINEANNIDFESYQQLAIRTKEFIYLDYNPTSEFWVHKELKDKKGTDFVILTYKDNEALDKSIVQEIEKAREKAENSVYWANWWRVYGLGEVGRLEGACIPDWQEVASVPEGARLVCYGMDFGYSSDPTTLIAIYKYEDKYIADEVIYQKGLLNSDISSLLKSNNIVGTIYADSAEPKSIAELVSYGHNVYPVSKGRDSIVYGINLINQSNLQVTSKSKNIIKELRSYIWKQDREGNTINVPIDAFNHAIDALRYGFIMQVGQSKGEYFIY